MRTLVTGGAGFIGSHLVDELLANGHEVRVLDNFSSGRRENLAHRSDVEIIEGDVRDVEACSRACKGMERIWHLAAVVSVPASVEDPLTTHETNATGALHMLLSAREHGAQRFVFVSSCAIYGDSPRLPCREDDPFDPVSPYANSKLAAEIYARQFAHLYGLETVTLRFFNVYGPRQNPASEYAAVVPKFLSALSEGRQPSVFGDGEQSRDFTYVADCVRAAMLAGFQKKKAIVGESFNVAAGRSTTVNQLLNAIKEALGSDIVPQYLPERPGEIRLSQASIEKAVSLLEFQPKWSLEDGIRETGRWLRSVAGG